MATLLELDAQGLLYRYDPELPGDQQELRCLYLMPRVPQWIEQTLPLLQPAWITEVSPEQQLDAALAIWARGDRLVYEHGFKPLLHLGAGIWEVKTHDLRLFGWFPNIDCFVCSAIADASQVKRLKLYGAYCAQAVHDRDTLDLDEPKFIDGDQPNAVVSNFSYP